MRACARSFFFKTYHLPKPSISSKIWGITCIMSISIEEVKKIATLARLNLTAEEEKRHAETISAVLDYMKILNEVNTKGVEQTSQVTGLEDVVREDVARDSEIKKELIGQMPEVRENELVVPAVFAEEDQEDL